MVETETQPQESAPGTTEVPPQGGATETPPAETAEVNWEQRYKELQRSTGSTIGRLNKEIEVHRSRGESVAALQQELAELKEIQRASRLDVANLYDLFVNAGQPEQPAATPQSYRAKVEQELTPKPKAPASPADIAQQRIARLLGDLVPSNDPIVKPVVDAWSTGDFEGATEVARELRGAVKSIKETLEDEKLDLDSPEAAPIKEALATGKFKKAMKLADKLVEEKIAKTNDEVEQGNARRTATKVISQAPAMASRTIPRDKDKLNAWVASLSLEEYQRRKPEIEEAQRRL